MQKVEGTHEAIIDRELWNRVHERLSKKRHVRKTKKDSMGLFSGKLFCADCKSPLAYMRKRRKSGEKGVYRCSRYNNYGGNACTPHYIDEDYLAAYVLNCIRMHARIATAERDQLTKRLLHAMRASREAELLALKANQREIEHRLAVNTSNLKNLYADKCSGKLPEQVFYGLMDDFTKEQRSLEEKLAGLSEQLRTAQNPECEVSDWLALIERQLEIQALDRMIVAELIESIEVSEAVKENGERRQTISIEYRFIGNLSEDAKEGIA